MANRALSVGVRRRYRVSRERLFRAFVEPNQLERWFSPSEDIATRVLVMDAKEGGGYRFGFLFPDGSENFVRGEFREVARPERLAFTWTWEPPDPQAGIETLVTIDLVAYGEETEVIVAHERFPNQETRDRHDQDWNGAFDRLEKLVVENGEIL